MRWGHRGVDVDGDSDLIDEFDWFDDPDDEERDGRPRSLRLVAVIVGVIALAGLVFLATLMLRDSDGVAGPPAPTAPAASTAAVLDASPSTTATTATSSSPPVSSPAATARSEVATLQTVPVIRDLVVVVDGTRYATSADGTIAVPPEHRGGTVTVVGVNALPALLEASFTGWVDGNTSPTRSLADVDGPVAVLGFTVSYRVQVVAGIAAEGTVAFDSDAGPVELPIGVPTFVPAVRATNRDGSLATETIAYRTRELRRGTASASIPSATFVAGPEARWNVSL